MMRQQDAKFTSDGRQTRKAFLARLRRTIKPTPAKVLTPLVKSMHRRCKALKQAGGMHFEEFARAPAGPPRRPSSRLPHVPHALLIRAGLQAGKRLKLVALVETQA